MTTDGGLHWTVVRATVGGIKYDLEITTRARLQEGDLVSTDVPTVAPLASEYVPRVIRLPAFKLGQMCQRRRFRNVRGFTPGPEKGLD